VDDGSTDKTWDVLQSIKSDYPKMKLIRFDQNQGKRHAMAAGAKAATGDILVVVDSDSFVEPEGLYRIVQPFVKKSIGAVSGHTLVEVRKDNPISKIESVRYYISHRILKTAESIFGAVTCCPGPFSAYRRSAVMQVLEAWLNQRFLGVRATFGDDRSLTNFILKTHQVIFHEGARCSTRVPDRWMSYFKQQLRWKKSWARETLVAARFMYKEHPIAAISYYTGVTLTLLSPFLLIHSLIYLPLVASTNPFPYLSGLLLAYFFLGLICLFLTGTPYWAYGMSFAFLYICVLSWQNYYAMLTVNKTKWGTR
jgi:hyaluronan synthase